jgi:Heterokaryon incompatibility protein Het-C
MFGSTVQVSFLITTLLQSIFAFNPNFPLSGFGLLGKPHFEITKDAITSRYKPYFGITTPARSMKLARAEIEDGAAIVDKHGEPLSEAENPTCHFDDEQFEASKYRLIAKKVDIANLLKIDEVSLAREMLGRALHTLQDFYSHSNWLDMGLSDISQNLGVKWLLEYYPVDPDLPTCKQCRYENADPALATAKIDVCRFLGAGVGTGLLDPMNVWAKSLVIGCLKGLSDKTISNCKEPSNLMVFPDLVNNPPHILTSGYFGTELKLHSHKKPYKCGHGGPFDRDADGLEGIPRTPKVHFGAPIGGCMTKLPRWPRVQQ